MTKNTMLTPAKLTAIENILRPKAKEKEKDLSFETDFDRFKTGSVKEKYYQSIHKKIISNISEMAGNEPTQVAKMMEYLLDEVGHALGEWQISVSAKDWEGANRTLHREKVMIKSIGINGFDGLIREIEDDTLKKTEAEMTLMYTQLIDLFQNLQRRISEK